MDKRYFIHSFARTLKLLEHVAEAGEPLTLSQIAKRMNMTLSTAYRFLYALQALGFVETDTDRKTYRLTPRILKLGHGLFRTHKNRQSRHFKGGDGRTQITENLEGTHFQRIHTFT